MASIKLVHIQFSPSPSVMWELCPFLQAWYQQLHRLHISLIFFSCFKSNTFHGVSGSVGFFNIFLSLFSKGWWMRKTAPLWGFAHRALVGRRAESVRLGGLGGWGSITQWLGRCPGDIPMVTMVTKKERHEHITNASLYWDSIVANITLINIPTYPDIQVHTVYQYGPYSNISLYIDYSHCWIYSNREKDSDEIKFVTVLWILTLWCSASSL